MHSMKMNPPEELRKKKRLSRDEYYMKMAMLVAQRSTCNRAQVGVVLVDNDTNRLVAAGYNGSPKGELHCIDVGCLIVDSHCVRTIHAELNAILHLEHSYSSLVMYTTHQPCLNCLKASKVVNVKKVVYLKSYDDEARDLWNTGNKVILTDYLHR